MLIGVPRETKTHEYRVGLTPASVRELTGRGHSVVVETGAGVGIGADDSAYALAGARILSSADEVFEASQMIVKVKEPLADDRRRLRPGQILFTYLHLAADRTLTAELLESGAACIAYETVTAPEGGLPLLTPMSEIAGRMSVQAAAHCLERSRGGAGLLLGGAVGVEPAEVVVLGGGIVGSNAAAMALGLGASVTVVDRSMPVLRTLNARFGDRLKTAYSTRDTVARLLGRADVVIGGVLIPGAAAPRLITAADVKSMKPGSVIVDVAIDQGGCAETSRPTTHAEPTYVVDDVVHYCVANMPGAVARTSTLVAEAIYRRASHFGKRVQAFGGAKNHMVIMPDADLDQAADALVSAGYGSAGERCMAISVAVPVGEETAVALVERLVPKVRDLKVGIYSDDDADFGPLVTAAAKERVESLISQGIAEGADLLVDGRGLKLQGYDRGYFVGPTLFDRVCPEMEIYRTEIFGPVLSVVRSQSFDDAVELINGHEYGNGVALFTRDGDLAQRFMRRVDVGMIGINVPIPVPMSFHHFGGAKRSKFGDTQMYGPDSIKFFTKLKTVSQRWPSSIARGASLAFAPGR